MTEYLRKRVEALPLPEKFALAKMLQKELANVSDDLGGVTYLPIADRARVYAEIMLEVAGVDIYSKVRTYPTPVCRGMVVRQLNVEGYSVSAAAAVFGMSHCTFVSNRPFVELVIASPHIYPDLGRIWKEFQSKIKEYETNERPDGESPAL